MKRKKERAEHEPKEPCVKHEGLDDWKGAGAEPALAERGGDASAGSRASAPDQKDRKIAELTDTLKRVAAEFDNFRKRQERDACRMMESASKELIRKLLPVLDNFGSALRNTSNHEEFVKGVRMIYEELSRILESEGLRRIECREKEFDPVLHEAIMTEEHDRDNIVLEEYQPGYTLNGSVLRHSRVKVGKKKEGEGRKRGGQTEKVQERKGRPERGSQPAGQKGGSGHEDG